MKKTTGVGKKRGTAPLWKQFLRALAIALVTMLLAAALGSALVRMGTLDVAGIPAAAAVCAALGAFAGAAYLSAAAENRKLPAAAALGGAFALLLLLGNLLFVRQAPTGFARISLPCLGAALAASVTVELLAAKRHRHH